MKAPLLTVGIACLAASAVLTSVVGSLQTREEKLGAGLVQILASLTGRAGGIARLWDTAALRQSAVVGRRGGEPVRAVALGKDSALLFAAAGARIEVWETARLLRRQ